MTTAAQIVYTQISLAANMPLNATEAFDEACGYRTEIQAGAISRAIQTGNQAALMALMLDLYSAAILRNEELADINRDEANTRADRLRDLRKDSATSMYFGNQVAV